MRHLTLNPALPETQTVKCQMGRPEMHACVLEIYTLFVSTENELESNMADSIETGG